MRRALAAALAAAILAPALAACDPADLTDPNACHDPTSAAAADARGITYTCHH